MKLGKRELFLLEKFEEVRAVAEELERLAIYLRRDAFRCHCGQSERMLEVSERLKFLAKGGSDGKTHS